jgi:hypothetical protein
LFFREVVMDEDHSEEKEAPVKEDPAKVSEEPLVREEEDREVNVFATQIKING